jgi:chromosomal replication initiation ATPase DnaA
MLNPHASFASFVVGSGNRLAATAAKAVAESPGSTYNPLFIYARPGLGKTHLLMAIGNEAIQFDGSRRVEYVTVDDFVEAYQAALAAGQADAYRRRFTEADVVLVDDAQLLADRRELQSELLRLIDVLTAADRQIVLAGDRPPEEIQQLDERLIRRFAGGLVIDIAEPDYETRLAILSRRADERQVIFPPSVLDTVAELSITTVRELLGALNRLIAQQAVQDEPLTVEQARKVLGALGHSATSAAAPASPSPAGSPPPAEDEFGAFLSDLTSSVAHRVDRWRQRMTEAALRWSGEGFRTGRIDAVLAGEMDDDPESILERFEADVAELRTLHEAIGAFAPELMSEAVLHDPDRVAEARQLVEDAREAGPPLPGPSPRYTLELFSAGAAARPAVEAIRSAALAPGQRYNPLVIVGHSGAGKTHLLHAFGHALRAGGLSRVAVLDGRTFVEGLVAALGEGSVPRWRQRLRRVDALLIDDVGVLAGKERSQEELYLLYNLLLESNRQMAFTATVPPVQLSGFEARLATRLAGGLVVELGLPDREAKVREVERLLGDAAVDPDLVDFLASRPAASLRELQQMVQRVTAAANERAVSLSVPTARRLLDGAPDEPHRPRRGSGLLSPGSGALRSREKMIETWPDIGERVIEEWR